MFFLTIHVGKYSSHIRRIIWEGVALKTSPQKQHIFWVLSSRLVSIKLVNLDFKHLLLFETRN